MLPHRRQAVPGTWCPGHEHRHRHCGCRHLPAFGGQILHPAGGVRHRRGDGTIAGLPVGYEDLMRLAIDHSDAIILASENVNQRLLNYAQNSGKPILPYAENNNEAYLDFCNNLLSEDETV